MAEPPLKRMEVEGLVWCFRSWSSGMWCYTEMWRYQGSMKYWYPIITTQHHNPEDHNLNFQCHDNLKSCSVVRSVSLVTMSLQPQKSCILFYMWWLTKQLTFCP